MNEGRILGIGTDIASISEIERLEKSTKGSFIKQTFSEKEKELANGNIFSYYAGRFAAKEAVFKAIAPLLGEAKFDFRRVETLRREDGSPYVYMNEEISEIMKIIGATDILVSISKQDDFALAFAVVVK